MSELTSTRAEVDSLLLQYRHSKLKLKEERKLLKKSRKKLKSVEEAQNIVQHIAQAVQKTTHARISRVVSRCLASIYDDPYEFQIIWERKRGQTEARLTFVRKGHEVHPLKASGGGPADIASFSLRLSSIALGRPQVRMLLLLDEPFKGLNPRYHHLVSELLMGLHKEMGLQVVMTTNIPTLACGKIIDLDKLDQ